MKNTAARKLVCPYCTFNSNRPQGLSMHVKSAHPKEWPAYRASSTALAINRNGEREPEPQTETEVVEVIPFSGMEVVQEVTQEAENLTAEQYAALAVTSLETQLAAARTEIQRLEKLRKLEQSLTRQLEAMKTAHASFGEHDQQTGHRES